MSNVTIDRDLKLVVPVERTDGITVYVHCAPVGREVFKTYYLVLSKAYAALMTSGISAVSGPRVAAMLLADVARNTPRGPGATWWEGGDGVERGLLGEIIRLANVLTPAPGGGWQTSPLANAKALGHLSEEDEDEVLNQAAFFTVAWRVSPTVDRETLVRGAARLSNSTMTSSNATAYASSLTTPTEDASTGANPQAA